MNQFRIDKTHLGADTSFTLFVSTNTYQWIGVFVGTEADCWTVAQGFIRVLKVLALSEASIAARGGIE